MTVLLFFPNGLKCVFMLLRFILSYVGSFPITCGHPTGDVVQFNRDGSTILDEGTKRWQIAPQRIINSVTLGLCTRILLHIMSKDVLHFKVVLPTRMNYCLKNPKLLRIFCSDSIKYRIKTTLINAYLVGWTCCTDSDVSCD